MSAKPLTIGAPSVSNGSTQQETGPTALRIVLGARLRKLRQECGISREDAGSHIRGSHAKISRLERGQVASKERDLADLLTLYHVTDPDTRAEFFALRSKANAPGWWHQLVSGLVRTGAVRQGQLLVHTSGRYGIDVLRPALGAGALPLALHPVMTFTGTQVDVQRLSGCSFGVTAPEELRLAAQALVIEMGGEPEWIAEEARPLYHAALALGANHLVTLVAQAMELLRGAGVGAPDRMLGPLLGAALDNALRSGDAALTGPVARGDAGTVAAHVAELRAHAPHAVAGYLAMARTTADRALAHGRLTPELAEDLLGVLGAPGHDRGDPQ